MINPVILSKLDASQTREINKLRVHRPEVDINTLASLIADGIFDRSLITGNLLKAAEMLGPFAVDKSKRIWHYSKVRLSSAFSGEISRAVKAQRIRP